MMKSKGQQPPAGRTQPPPLPDRTVRYQPDDFRPYWITAIVVLLAILILLLLLVARSRQISGEEASQQGGPGGAVAEDADLSTQDAAAESSSGGESEQETMAELDVGKADDSQPEDPDGNEPEDSEQTNRDGELETEATTDVEVAESAAAADSKSAAGSPSRVRQLNMGNGTVPLLVGDGNPLRVGPDVGSVVYVIDKSSSMTGQPFIQVRLALQDAIDSLQDDQEFAVLMFDSQMYPVTPLRLSAATRATRDSAKRALDQVFPGGSTSPFEAAKNALDLKPDSVVILSDGEFNLFETEQITQYNHASRPVTTIHTVGLRQNIRTLQQLSRDNGNGTHTTANVTQGP